MKICTVIASVYGMCLNQSVLVHYKFLMLHMYSVMTLMGGIIYKHLFAGLSLIVWHTHTHTQSHFLCFTFKAFRKYTCTGMYGV